MAPGMKHWLGLTALGIAGALVLLLPPRDLNYVASFFEESRNRPVTPAAARWMELQGELATVNSTLQRLRTERVLESRLAAAVSAGDPVLLEVMMDGLDGAWVDVLQRRLDEQMATLDGPSAVALGVFVVPTEFGSSETTSRTHLFGRNDVFAGNLPDGRPYCAHVVRLWNSNGRAQRHQVRGDPLDLCATFARYGAPGPGVRRWLEAAGWAFASDAELPDRLSDSPGIRKAFGVIGGRYRWFGGFHADACLNRDPRMCRDLLLDPGAPERRIASFVGEGRWDSRMDARERSQELTSFVLEGSVTREAPFGQVSNRFLHDLERREGPEAFERFWTSPGTMEDGFESAFGEPAGEWVQAWLRSYHGSQAYGPGLPARTAGLCLLTFLLASGIGVLVHRGRAVAR